MLIGILALQGNVREHAQNLERHKVACRPVKIPGELGGIDGLILPGGESTALKRLIENSGLKDPVQRLIQEGLPVWGTCAGVILLAEGGIWESVDVTVERNAYGSQVHSRIAPGRSSIAESEIPMVFIRAPRISQVRGKVEVLAERDGDIVGLRKKNILLTTFHPELVTDSPFTVYFLDMVRSRMQGYAQTCVSERTTGEPS